MAALIYGVNPSFGKEVDVVKAGAIISAFLAWVAAEVFTEQANATQLSPHDVSLYEKFRGLFNGATLEFLREHDFGGSFHPDAMDGVVEFAAAWQGKTYEFQNRRLNKKLRQCKVAAAQMSRLFAYKTYPHHSNPNLQTAVTRDPQTGVPDEQSNQAIKELNETATLLHDAADDLQGVAVRVGLNSVSPGH